MIFSINPRNLYWQGITNLKKCVRSIDSVLKPLYCPLYQRKNHGVFAVNIDAHIGFFAHLSWCLHIFAHCQRFKLTPYVMLSSPLYSVVKGEDWFDYFFENIKLRTEATNIQNRHIRICHISDLDQLGLPKPEFQMTIEKANKLFEENIRIKPSILDYVEAFITEQFKKKAVLGIHYRGTDKQNEAAPVTWEFCAETISNYLKANPQIEALFVASDEAAFVKWIEAQFSHIEVIYHDDQEQSQNGKAIHTQSTVGNNYTKGKEALVNCLLLSKCHALIRTASYLSAWSSIFNPEIPVIMLNRPYPEKLWFPDNLVVEKSINGYLPS